MRAAALAELDRKEEAKSEIDQLLKLAPEFETRGRQLISSYVKVDGLVDRIIYGLRKGGMEIV